MSQASAVSQTSVSSALLLREEGREERVQGLRAAPRAPRAEQQQEDPGEAPERHAFLLNSY